MLDGSFATKQALHRTPLNEETEVVLHFTWRDKVWRKQWKGHGKTSIPSQFTEKYGRNGPPDLLVTGRTKV